MRCTVLTLTPCVTGSEGILESLSPKIWRLGNGVLYGAAGRYCDDRLKEIIEIHGGECHRDMFLGLDNSENHVLFITPEGCLYFLHVNGEDDVLLYEMNSPYAAVGYGSHHALGLMAGGASAAKAVEMTIPRAAFLHGPVQTLKLDNRRKRRK
jgi:hypothetical protein